jgi:C-terminal processing protease CtpA/Prc
MRERLSRAVLTAFRLGALLPSALVAVASCAPARAPEAGPSTVVLPPPQPGPGPADPAHRALDAHELGNLVAFTRLLGYLRYFHPSDGALVADWDAVAVAGMGKVENASTPDRLAGVLSELVAPVAPTVRVHRTGASVAMPPELLPPELVTPPPAIVGLIHHGLGGGRSNVFRNERVDDREPHPSEPGEISQALDAAPFRGMRVRVRASVRAEVRGEAAGALFGIRVMLPGGLTGFVDEMEDRPIVAKEWRDYAVSGDVDDNADRIVVRFRLTGGGKAWIDDVSLEATDRAGGRHVDVTVLSLVNAGFERSRPGEVPEGWQAGGPPVTTGYQIETSGDRARRGARCASIASVKIPPHHLADPASTLDVDLGAGVSARIPLTLYRDERGTLPHVPWPRTARGARARFEHVAEDRPTRFAVVALAWNAVQHFYPYFDVVSVDWPAELRHALAQAAVAPDAHALLGTLRRMMAPLHDGHGEAALYERTDAGEVRQVEEPRTCLPLGWAWVDDRLVISSLRRGVPRELHVGDVVTAVGGVPAWQALDARVVSAATPQAARFLALHDLRCGPPNEAVELAVTSLAEIPSVVTAQRREPPSLTVVGSSPDTPPGFGLARSPESFDLDEPRPDKVAELEPGIAYVDLSRAAEADIEGATDQLAAARGIVFDLRGRPRAPGHSVLRHLADAPLESPRWLLPRISRPDHEAPAFTALPQWTVEPASPRFRAKVAFLTDGRASGFAETLLGIVEHYHLGEIVGEPTAGTNGDVTSIHLPAGYDVSFTGMKVLKHDGSRHHGVGIQPTIPVSRTRAGIAAGTDQVLERALRAVRGSPPT